MKVQRSVSGGGFRSISYTIAKEIEVGFWRLARRAYFMGCGDEVLGTRTAKE